MAQQIKSWLLNTGRVLLVQQQIFINKIHYGKWNHIRTIIVPFSIYYIRNFSLYVLIRKVLLEFLQLEIFFILTVLVVTILFNFKEC